jgi:hypothetical protein
VQRKNSLKKVAGSKLSKIDILNNDFSYLSKQPIVLIVGASKSSKQTLLTDILSNQ